MTNFPYCIKHEHSTMAQTSLVGDCHEVLFFNEFGQLDIDWCFYEMGYTYCEIPETREDWDEDEEPSPEELEKMNENAELVIWE